LQINIVASFLTKTTSQKYFKLLAARLLRTWQGIIRIQAVSPLSNLLMRNGMTCFLKLLPATIVLFVYLCFKCWIDSLIKLQQRRCNDLIGATVGTKSKLPFDDRVNSGVREICIARTNGL
jgi:hypothetical protein